MSRSHDPADVRGPHRCGSSPILTRIYPFMERLCGGGLLLIAAFVLAGLTATPPTAQAQQQDTLDRARREPTEQLRERQQARMRKRMRERQKEIQAQIRRSATPPAPSGVMDQDSLALVALYNNTDGDNWEDNDGWLEEPVSEWHGVTVGGDRVISVGLGANQLTGEIPSELSELSNLEILNLRSNQLTGEIPVELSELSNLENLRLFNNQLMGEIPVELSELSSLEDLFLGGNQLTGEIPVELSELSALEGLGLGYNQLTGEIPAEFSELSNLEELDLFSNQLTGEIPVELSELSNLEVLGLGSNQLTGEVPVELSELSNLIRLRLRGNQLTGAIPPSFTDLTAMSNSEFGLFYFNNTNLCEPSDPDFQDWLDSINDVQSTGMTCSDSGGLVAYYPFDGSANDASGNGNDGELYGNPQFVEGQQEQAISFDGDGDFVQTGSSESLKIDERLTFAGWVFVDQEEISARKTLAVQGTIVDTDGNWEIFVLEDGILQIGKK